MHLLFVAPTDVCLQHLVASQGHILDPVMFMSAAYNQLRLNHLDAQTFLLPKFPLSAERDITSKCTCLHIGCHPSL
jgi:hypothetical protein